MLDPSETSDAGAPVARPPLEVRGLPALGARLHAWRGDPRVGAVVLALVAVFAGVVWFRTGSHPDGGADRGDARPAGLAAAAAPSTTSTSVATDLVVHVAGAVARPGVVRLRPDARVIDALDAAGGASPDADLDRLNLAAPLSDGTRVAVPRVGEPAVPLDPSAPGGGSATGGEGVARGPIDVNVATEAELETLPGIGPTLAAAIIAERERNGPFRSVDDLERVRGIGSGRLDALRDLVRV